MNSPINDENILNVVYKYTRTSELELQLASVSDENVYQSVPSTYSAFFSQSESAFLNTTNHYQMTQYENGGAVKENPIQPLKRKLSVPDQLWHANGSFEDSHVSLRKRIKSSKRTPFQNIQNQNEIEVAKFLTELPYYLKPAEHRELTEINNQFNEQIKQEEPPAFQMTCDSDHENLSPIKQSRQCLPEPIYDLSMPNLVENNMLTDLDSVYAFEPMNNPPFVSSTPYKQYSNSNENLNDDSELFTICAEIKIHVSPGRFSNRNLASDQEENELEQSVNTTPEIFYSDEDLDGMNPAKKQKLKVKLNFNNNHGQTSSGNAAKASNVEKKIVKRVKRPENEQLNFAIDVILNTFSEQEIRQGIFVDCKSLNSRSKTRVAFSQEKHNSVKNAIGLKFQLEGDELEETWQLLRSKLNVRIKCLPTQKRFQKKFNTN